MFSPLTGKVELRYPLPIDGAAQFAPRGFEDEFGGSELGLEWNFRRTPSPPFHSLTARPGALRLHLVEQLTSAGFPAVAPERLADFGYRDSERFGIASNWSERHTAWIAGLGTFGLSDGLITRAGKAVRFGSVVARAELVATPRPYTGHQDWCLWHARGTCGVCMKRCPIDAITEKGHDKAACFDYIRNITTPYVRDNYGTGATPCGLCQVKIPCEAKPPI